MRSTFAPIALALLATAASSGAVTAGGMKHESRHSNWTVTHDGDEERFAWVLVKPGDDHTQSGSGQSDDFERARKLGRRFNSDFLYVRQGDERFVIRDPEVLERVEEIMEPQEMLGRQQGLLGRQQGRMGRDQGRLGEEQAELGRRQARLAARQAELGVELARRVADGLSARDLERRMQALGEEQAALGERQGVLGEQQAKLGEQQAELGQRQAELGEKQAKLSREISRKLEALVDEEPVRRLAVPIG
jgi:hypothetical protein